MGITCGGGDGRGVNSLPIPPPPYYLIYANGDEKITCNATHLIPQIHFVS